MGSKTYEYLTESFLFDDSLLKEEFASISEERLASEIEGYKSFALQEAPTVEAEIQTDGDSLAVLSAEPLKDDFLLQAALYVNQYIIEDPFFQLGGKRDQMSQVLNRSFDLPTSDEVNRKELSSVARRMKGYTPFVAGDFLKFLPSVEAAKRADTIPIRYSKTAFADALPQEVMRIFKEAVTVRSMKRVDGKLLIENKLDRCNAISIDFKGDGFRDYFYTLWDTDKLEFEANGSFEGVLTLANNPVEAIRFKQWVKQSVNQASASMFDSIVQKLAVAARLNITVSTQSELLARALRAAYKPQSLVPIQTANVFMNLELPFIAGFTAEQVMRVREEGDGDAFRRFRRLLDQKLGFLRAEEDAEKVREAAASAMHELTQLRMDELDSKLVGVKEKFKVSAAIATLGVAVAIQTAGASMLSAVGGGAITLGKTYYDYRQDVKRNPAFFLWKLLRSKRSR